MKQRGAFWFAILLGIFVTLSACSGQQRTKDHNVGAANLDFHQKSLNKNGNGEVHSGGHHNPDVIPSIDRSKKQTTDSVKGLGTNVYSLIGSSSLHSGGVSSHLESRLSTEGIPGIKVFVLDDTVILARAKPEVTSNSYDSLQNRVLSNHSGASGKGDQTGVKQNADSDDNLDKAKALMTKAFGGQVQILTITNPAALPLIDGIKANLKNDNPSYSKLSSDLNTLIKMTHEK